MSSRRRDIYIGAKGSPPKRLKLPDLLDVVHEIQAATDAIADDLGIPEADRTQVELVDMLAGSSGLSFEQAAPEAATPALVPLAVWSDAVADVAHGRPPPGYLTARSVAAIQQNVVVFHRLSARGSPVELRTTDDHGAPVSVVANQTSAQPVVQITKFVPPESIADEPSVAAMPSTPAESAKWLVEASGKIDRLDDGAKKLTLRVSGRVVQVQLSDEQFAVVDGDDVRWKEALVRARSVTPKLRSDSVVLDVLPHVGLPPVEAAKPESEGAIVMQETLDN